METRKHRAYSPASAIYDLKEYRMTVKENINAIKTPEVFPEQ
jgi:hypothetical protein